MGLAANEVLGDGRYQLLAQRGADEFAGVEFWHAWDVQHDRNIALTVLVGDPADPAAVAWARHVLEGVRYADTATHHPALARVRYLPGPGHAATSHNGVLGLVVADWTDGVDLVDVVRDGPLAVGAACRLLRPLVAAVDGAHHVGVVAGVDSPYRIRIGERGTAVLAFRGTRPDATTRDDVRGLGALLYLLLTGAWPDMNNLVLPSDVRPDVPRDLSLIALLSIDGTRVPDIRTCGPLLRALDEVIAYETETTADMPLLLPETPAPPPLPPEPVAAQEEPAPVPVKRPSGRGRLIAVGTAVVAVAAAALVGAKVAGAFGVPATTEAAAHSTSVSTPHTTVPTTTPPPTTTTQPPPLPPPVRPASVSEYIVAGNPDDPRELNNVMDGDPTTTWKTDVYQQQFPMMVPGIGIMVALPHPMTLASVTITSPSPGTVVEIHSATAPDVSLTSAPLLGTATLNDGMTTIPLRTGAPTPYVLVWITQLTDHGSAGYESEIAEISCQPMA